MKINLSKSFIVTDLDGTLFPQSKIVSDKDVLSIRKFTSLGGKFSIATGRPIQSVLPLLKMLKITTPVVLYNGAMIYDTVKNQPIWHRTLPSEIRDFVKNILDKFPDVAAEILTFDNIYSIQINDTERYHIRITDTNPKICMLDEVPDGWLKALFAATPERLIDVIEYAKTLSASGVSFVQSCEFFYEIIPENVSKGYALEKMIELTGFDDFTVFAVGDYYNDIEMLKAANVGFVVANAHSDVKEIADIVLDSGCEENAISEVIEYIIFNAITEY